MKRYFAAITAMAMLLSGCSAAGNIAPDTAETTTAATAAEGSSLEASEITLPDISDNPHADMIERSLVSLGNTYSLNEKLDVLKNGGEITIGFLGGSITEGYTVKPDECYAKLTYDWLCKKYPEGTLNYVNAGISGTPSILGNMRVKRDIIDKGADIVFIEYAVNDGSDKIYNESYDSLIKTLLNTENAPAIVLLLNRTKEGHTAQDYMKDIGEYYSLPMISTVDALTPALEDGSVTWEDFYNDSSHPSPEGHRLFLEFISYFFDCAIANPSAEPAVKKYVGRHGSPFENALMAEADYDNSDPMLTIEDIGCFDMGAGGLNGFRAGWAFDPDSESDSMKFTITGNSLWLICNRNKSDAMGSIEVWSDGKLLKTIHLNDKDGWGDPWAYQAMKWSTVAEHTIELKVPEEDREKKIELLAIGVTANNNMT